MSSNKIEILINCKCVGSWYLVYSLLVSGIYLFVCVCFYILGRKFVVERMRRRIVLYYDLV